VLFKSCSDVHQGLPNMRCKQKAWPPPLSGDKQILSSLMEPLLEIIQAPGCETQEASPALVLPNAVASRAYA